MSFPKLSSNQLKLVSNNLQNIYVAAHDDENRTIELVPSIFTSKLYCSKVGWRGRVLRILHTWIAHFVGNDYREKRLQKALKATQECYEKLENFRHHFLDPIYKGYLDHHFYNTPRNFSEKEVDHARRQIQAFYQATYPITKLIKEHTNDKLNKFLESHFKKGNEQGTAPFYSKATFKTLKGYVKIMAIEGFAAGEIPLSVFRKISIKNQADPAPLVAKVDEKKLISFVKKMHKAKKQGNFQVKVFHSAMKSIVQHLKENQQDNVHDIKQLEQALIKEGCILLHEFDKKHVEWRQNIKKDDEFVKPNEPLYFLNNHHEKFLFAVGDQLKGRDYPINRYNVYEIHNPQTLQKYDNFLMVIGPNKICLEYSDIMRAESFWGLDIPEIQYIHPQGKYAIVEKLPYSIDSIQWQSSLLGPLEDEDKKYADPLRMLIQFFIDEKNSPKDLKAEHLRFDSIGRLKSIKDCIPSGRIDYIAFEEMVYHLAQGKNLPIYQYLVEPLREERYSKRTLVPFFREAVASAFEKHVVSIERLAKKRRIVDQAIMDKARHLQKFANQIKEDCWKILCNRYDSVDKDKLRKQMSNCLLRSFDNDKTLGRFWNNVQPEDLLEEIEKNPKSFLKD